MTIKEFFESNIKLAIRCRTKDKANLLCLLFDKAGYRWADKITRYTKTNNYERYDSNTCYTNHNTFSDVGYLINVGYKILEFKDIEIEVKLWNVDYVVQKEIYLK